MRTLQDIIQELQTLPKKPDDTTHQIADSLLIEALHACTYLQAPPRVDLIMRIEEEYHKIEKWYA